MVFRFLKHLEVAMAGTWLLVSTFLIVLHDFEAKPSLYVFNGKNAKEGQFPYQLFLVAHFRNGITSCGGVRKSLIY